MEHPSIAPGESLLHFRLIGKIGQGGMGEVWRAVDTTLDREVAVKLLPQTLGSDPERLARFDREAKLLASLNHPNIAAIYGLHAARSADAADAVRFLSLELVPGEDLSERLARGPLPVDEALEVARQLAEALEAAHGQGVIHRDLKPANVKRTPEGTVKVLDFGLAKALDPSPLEDGADPTFSPTITSLGSVAGMIVGTAAYMAPEQAKGLPVDRRADVWAFGVVLFEMLTGQRLFEGETVSETLASVMKDEPDWDRLPASLPVPVHRVLRRCLVKDPRERFRDVGDVLLELVAPLDDALPAMPGETDDRTRRRERRAWTVAVLAGVAALVLGLVAFGLRRSAVPAPSPFVASIPAPAGVRFNFFGDFAAPPVLSPDGSLLVFGGSGKSGLVLWLYSLETGELRALDGTEGATFPFWSPDGRTIGYFADARLKRVDVTGGNPVVICDAPNGRGGAWGPDDVILFSPAYQAAILGVDADGGEPRPVTTLAPEQSTHRWPSFLPDGVRFLYLATSHAQDEATPELRLGSVDGSVDRAVLPSMANAVYADGMLLFARGKDLMAQPYDPDSFEPTGEARVLAPTVLVDPSTWHAAFTAATSTSRLIYASGDSFAGTQLQWYDRAGNELSVTAPRAQNGNLRLSPDAGLVAVGIESDVWLFDFVRKAKSRFTFDEFIESSPLWTPDGATIYYRQTGRPDMADRILRRPASGAGRAELVFESPDPVDAEATDISPDGRFLLMSRGRGPFIDRSDLWLLPLEGGEAVPLTDTPAAEADGRWSPDGRWIAFTSNESGRVEVYVVPFDAAGQRLGGGRWQVSENGASAPVWRADGRELFFMGLDRSLRVASVEAAAGEIHFGPPQTMFSVAAHASGRVWDIARDGQRVLVASFGDAPERPLRIIGGWPETLGH